MEDWTRSEVIALMGLFVAIVAGIAAIIVIPKFFWKVVLGFLLIVISVMTGLLLNSNLKKEGSKDSIVVYDKQINFSPTPLQSPQLKAEAEQVKQLENRPMPSPESNVNVEQAKLEMMKKFLIGKWESSATFSVQPALEFTVDEKLVFSSRFRHGFNKIDVSICTCQYKILSETELEILACKTVLGTESTTFAGRKKISTDENGTLKIQMGDEFTPYTRY